MSLETCLGCELSVYEETEEHANRLILNSPVLSPAKFHALKDVQRPGYEAHSLSLAYDPEQMDLRAAIVDLCQRAESAVRQRNVLLILRDDQVPPHQLTIHALMPNGA